MSNTIQHLRGEFEVTPAWAKQNLEPYPHFAVLSHTELEIERLRLLTLSNSRRLTTEERARLTSVTHVINVHRALDVIPEHHSNFGFDGADQLHGNSVRQDCGCELHFVFDHHKDHTDPTFKLHPHTPRDVCAEHEPHLEKGLDHFHQVVLETNSKAV